MIDHVKVNDRMNAMRDIVADSFVCRVQYLDDSDPFMEYNVREPPRPLYHTFNTTIPLSYQIAAVHRLLQAPHRVSSILKFDFFLIEKHQPASETATCYLHVNIHWGLFHYFSGFSVIQFILKSIAFEEFKVTGSKFQLAQKEKNQLIKMKSVLAYSCILCPFYYDTIMYGSRFWQVHTFYLFMVSNILQRWSTGCFPSISIAAFGVIDSVVSVTTL